MKIIGITGVARSGKDTLATYLVEHHGFSRIALADPLREFVSSIADIPFEQLLDGPAKEQPVDWLGGRTPRYMMQTLGTEWGRNKVDREVWLKVARRRIEKAARWGESVVIPDVRFDNEAEMVRQMGGEVIQVVRPGVGLKLSGWRSQVARVLPKGAQKYLVHPSERGVNPFLIDCTVQNSGSITDLAVVAETLAL